MLEKKVPLYAALNEHEGIDAPRPLFHMEECSNPWVFTFQSQVSSHFEGIAPTHLAKL